MRVLVVGAGTMGAGIAQTAAVAGHAVTLHDRDAAALERARGAIGSSLDRLVRKEKLTRADADAALERIERVGELDESGEPEVVIEAIVEDLEVKRAAWRELAERTPSGALLATNTSSLSVTALAAASGRPERFVGLHFFNPVPVLPLVEVVRGERSATDAVDAAVAFAEGIGKTPIVCDDTPGFVVNRLLIPYMNDAVFALAEGVASAEDIDRAMTLGANMPLGPLALCDLVGLDVALAAAESLQRETNDPKFRVHPLLRRKVRAGKLGRKSGEGFFRYDD